MKIFYDKLSGNVKNDYFHFETVGDIEAFVETLCMLVAIDALSLILSSIFLKVTCNINMLQVWFYNMPRFSGPYAPQDSCINR